MAQKKVTYTSHRNMGGWGLDKKINVAMVAALLAQGAAAAWGASDILYCIAMAY